MSIRSMSTTLPCSSDRSEPNKRSGGDPVAGSVALRDCIYRCLQLAVEQFEHEGVTGGTALAEAMGVSRTDTCLRIARKEDSKGQLQRAFLDFLGPLLLHPQARRTFVEELMLALDYEPPVPRRRVTEEDIGRGAMEWVKSLPASMRDAAKADIARALGVRVEDLKL